MPALRVVRRVLLAAALGAVVGVLGSCGDGDQGQPTTTSAAPGTTTAPGEPPSTQAIGREVAVEVRGGAVVGGPARVQARLGEHLRFVVRSDVADEVHIHGYDRRAEVTAGGQVTLELTADIAGRFEIELERRKLRLGELVVRG